MARRLAGCGSAEPVSLYCARHPARRDSGSFRLGRAGGFAKRMSIRVLHVTAELYPWVKSGGLGDVAAALPPALAELGVDTRLLLPGFSGFLDSFPGIADVARLNTPFAPERVRVGLARLPGSERLAYLIDQPAFYDRPGNPYAGPDGRDWPRRIWRLAHRPITSPLSSPSTTSLIKASFPPRSLPT